MSSFRVEAVVMAFVAASERMSGPFPRTKTRKLLTPGTADCRSEVPSARPSATGITPRSGAPGTVEHLSLRPEQSAKLMIIEGDDPSAAGLLNRPSVACVD